MEDNAQNTLNTIQTPEDAGEHQEGLLQILRKIPHGWRWIECGKGWYPIIVSLDQGLEALAPGYEVHQVKEKFGTLRYYYALPEEKDPYTTQNPEPSIENSSQQQWDEWNKGWTAWRQSEQGQAYEAKSNSLADQAQQLVQEAEQISAVTCELCGKPGMLQSGTWLATRCNECA